MAGLFAAGPEGAAAAAETARALAASRPGLAPRFAWQWMSPALAVFLLGLFIHGNQAGGMQQFHPSARSSLLARAALQQPEFSAYYADSQHGGNNALRNTFEWTNGNNSLSTAPPMAPTNSVWQQ